MTVIKLGSQPREVFVSSEQTGTGSEQEISHGMKTIPAVVLIALTEVGADTACDVAEGTHNGVYVKATVTSGVKFKVLAIGSAPGHAV